MDKFLLDDSNKNYDIYIDLIYSTAGKYLSRRPYLIALIKESLTMKKLRGAQMIIEYDMGRNIGTTDVVETSDKDTIYYAQAIKSEVFSRFVKNRYPQESSVLTIVFERNEYCDYEVTDTWIGNNRPAFPGDEMESSGSKKFWLTHALVQDALAIKSKTLTKICPY